MAEAPCDWEISYSACDDLTSHETLTADQVAQVEDMATEFLWRWTGRVYGVCEATIQPCPTVGRRLRTPQITNSPFDIGVVGRLGPWESVYFGGQRFDLGCGVCADSCGCGDTSTAIRLPGHVQSITSITIEGVVLDPSAYRLTKDGTLFRTDGEAWPRFQDRSLPPGGPGTWEIELTYGIPVPVGGQVAAGVLANEFARAFCRDSKCALPVRVQQVSRQGVSIVMDTFDDLERGGTGIWMVDSWVTSIMKPAQTSTVLSPDLHRGRTHIVR